MKWKYLKLCQTFVFKKKNLKICSKVTLQTLKSDQHLISPYSYTAESFIKIMRIKEMIANLRSFDC